MHESCRTNVFAATLLLATIALPDSSAAAGQQSNSTWSPPVNLGTPPNSEFVEICPSISADGKSLYFFSDRPGGFGSNDLYVSQRHGKTEKWGPPKNLGPKVNTPHDDSAAWLSYDGHLLFLSSDRPGSQGGLDIWVSWRRDTRDDFSWEPPINLTSVNSPANDLSPVVHLDRQTRSLILYFASNRPGGPGLDDIYESRFAWKQGRFTPPTLVAELSSPALDRLPAVRPDGGEMIIASNRTGTLGALDLWSSRRMPGPRSMKEAHISPPVWSEPVNMGADINSVEVDGCGRFSLDARSLYLHSTRLGGFPLFDLYVSKLQKDRR